ncbi:MAG: glutamine--fructose-6-phosphate transaminase (isomerizing) [Clostridiales Family XIII bacterium]|jgi:glucosamine--fructose-6-phosphate aminotransferase (isomerizing)|nr:glutamine--fructose-6-phosphate transaminase (isomerizing) [Clostridiales Family XIII bacterium]
MCGIVGYVGDDSAKEVILTGLQALEYRGYDSAGIALSKNGKLLIRKESGELKNLVKRTQAKDFEAHIGIGHTRWATHGSPTRENAHPHVSQDGRIAIVHNGIIENYQELRQWLTKEHNIEFKSVTDSEAIAHLVSIYYKGDLLEAVMTATEKLSGAYAIGVIACDNPDEIVAARMDAPLITGIGENGNYLASDSPALLKYTRDIYVIENGEYVVITKDNIRIMDKDGTRIRRQSTHVDLDAAAAEKGGHPHFMIKEIYEQPEKVKEALKIRLDKHNNVKLEGIHFTKAQLEGFDRVYIVACGTAYHAGLIGKYAIEKYAKIPVEVDVASEFRYRDPFVDDKTLVICISQSGETSDTLEALREAKKRGGRILSLVNVVGSSVARESDDVLYTWAGLEIAVASTKAYTTQLICLYLVALYMGKVKGSIDTEHYRTVIDELLLIPEKLETVIRSERRIRELAEDVYKKEQIFFIGRGVDVATSLEGSLKLKEISYINSFAIAAGELKHGTIALIRRGTLFLALATQDKVYEKMISNIEEIKARKAFVVTISKDSRKSIEKVADRTLYIPDCIDDLTPILAVVPLQLFSYHIAKLRGKEIDKPRNLAKSVTVE